jgi:magnesium-transporting ATPase (P-type)
MLTFPIWFYGFWSYFSGVPIYDTFLYQLYNVVFTSWPIIWYAVMDWEHSKEDLLNDPKHYKIGLQDKYFNTYAFFKWFAFALWQGTLLLIVCFFSVSAADGEGHSSSMFESGLFIFNSVCIVANAKVLSMSRQKSIFIILLCTLSAAASFLVSYLLNLMVSYQGFGTFGKSFNTAKEWFAMAFFVVGFIIMDEGANAVYEEWVTGTLAKIEAQERKEQEEVDSIKKTVSGSLKKMFTMSSFAYSSAPGNDRELTHNLSSKINKRLTNMLSKRMEASGLGSLSSFKKKLNPSEIKREPLLTDLSSEIDMDEFTEKVDPEPKS